MKNCAKKLALLFLSVIFALSLSGCIRAEIDLNIKSNGKADVSFTYAMSDALASMGDGSTISEEEFSSWKEKGYVVTPYAQDGYSGIVAKASDIDVDELCADKNGVASFTGNNFITRNGSKYVLDMDLWENNESLSEGSQYLGLINSYGGYLRFTLTTPYKATNHNATRVSEDGKTLTWDLLNMYGEPVHAEFKVSPFGIIPLLLATILIGLIALVVVMKRRKSKKAIEINNIVASELPVSDNPTAVESPSAEGTDTAEEQLRQIKKLFDDGIITQEDYDAKKKQLLGL